MQTTRVRTRRGSTLPPSLTGTIRHARVTHIPRVDIHRRSTWIGVGLVEISRRVVKVVLSAEAEEVLLVNRSKMTMVAMGI